MTSGLPNTEPSLCLPSPTASSSSTSERQAVATSAPDIPATRSPLSDGAAAAVLTSAHVALVSSLRCGLQRGQQTEGEERERERKEEGGGREGEGEGEGRALGLAGRAPIRLDMDPWREKEWRHTSTVMAGMEELWWRHYLEVP